MIVIVIPIVDLMMFNSVSDNKILDKKKNSKHLQMTK